ncbi:hypothetical protein NM688_g3134 [Phlebia brevispora]|uniref:Uncharacterized protein n=1 Tax=Phlebia brevispora TaxID=194682 RepID=A0ACC1T6Q9_9APHY|nr:hypothetical protein NM688_g3134 [Phlebia brevispora]
MPFILRRARQTELAPSRSFMDVVKSKIHLGSGVNEKPERRTREYASPVAQLNLTDYPDPSLTRGFHHSRRNDVMYHIPHRIMQLPAELLAYIFVLGSEDDTRIPVVISHVCRVWRAVALHTPLLWRHISLDSRKFMWIERIRRAKACTLDVELRPQMQPGRRTLRRAYLDARSVESYMLLVIPHIPRWRSLRIEFQHYAPHLWNAALSACCGTNGLVQAPRLEHISLIHPYNDDTKEFLLFNGYAPRLRSATIQGIRLAWLPALFANLTVLDYTHHSFTRGHDAFFELFSMLQVSSQLQELRLAFPPRSHHSLNPHSADIPANAHLHLDKLRSLTLHVSAEDIPSALLQLIPRLRMRGLKSLSLVSPPPSALIYQNRHYRDLSVILPPPFLRLRNFFKVLPRLSKLSHLRIEHAWCESSFVLSLLKFHVPLLKHLTLASPYVNDAFLWSLGEELRGRHYHVGHLNMQEYVPGVWHNGPVTLSTLDVVEIAGARITSEGVASVVRRMLGGGVLWVKEVWIKDCAGVDGTVMERVGAIRCDGEGMDGRY